MKCVVDTSAPRSYSHITDNSTGRGHMKNRLRQEEIARDNAHLIDHLYEIRKKHSHRDSKSHGTVKSLNLNRRKQEIARINEENKAILRALQRTKSVYRYEDLVRFQRSTEELRQRLTSRRNKDSRRPLVTSAIAQSVSNLAAVSSQGWRRPASRIRNRPHSSLDTRTPSRLKGRRTSDGGQICSVESGGPLMSIYSSVNVH